MAVRGPGPCRPALSLSLCLTGGHGLGGRQGDCRVGLQPALLFSAPAALGKRWDLERILSASLEESKLSDDALAKPEILGPGNYPGKRSPCRGLSKVSKCGFITHGR